VRLERAMTTFACPSCDLLHISRRLQVGETARCVRCDGALPVPGPYAFEIAHALTCAALLTFWIANTEPLMRISELGFGAHTTLAGCVAALWVQASPATAILVAVCSIAAPGAFLALTLAALLAIRRTPAPQWTAALVRYASVLRDWAMPEVMMLGTLVSYVKISELADASPGVGMYATGALAILMAGLRASLDLPGLWSQIERAR
jgi:paraquat-inducible protein A